MGLTSLIQHPNYAATLVLHQLLGSQGAVYEEDQELVKSEIESSGTYFSYAHLLLVNIIKGVKRFMNES